jgi:hypothetical protein
MADESRDFEIVSTTHTPALQKMLAKPDAGANPFKIVIDPKVRMDLRRALIDLIDYHDEAQTGPRFLQGIHRAVCPQFERNNGKPGRRFLFAAVSRVRCPAG